MSIKAIVDRATVYDRLVEERAYQDRRWATLDATNSVADFLTYIGRYVRQATAANRGSQDAALHALRKVAALCVAVMEQHGWVPRSRTRRFVVQVPTRDAVFQAIDDERAYQDRNVAPWLEAEGLRSGSPSTRLPLATLGSTLVLLRRFLRKAEDAWCSHGGDGEALDVVREIAAIAVRELELRGCPARGAPPCEAVAYAEPERS